MAIHDVRVSTEGQDHVGRDVRDEAIRSLGVEGLDEVRTTKVYRLQGVDEEQTHFLAAELFTDQVAETSTVDESSAFDTPYIVEVGYKPGVMNPASGSMTKGSKDLDVDPQATDSLREYAFFGSLGQEEVDKIVHRLLVNPTVQQVVTQKPETLIFEGQPGPVNTVPIREATDEQLMEMSKDKLALNLEEMRKIQADFRRMGRDPTDCEVEHFAANGSEHCKHKTFNADVVVNGEVKPPLYTRIKEKAKEHFKDLVVSAFGDNSGVIRFYDGQAICGKVETHNSPSAIEPYGGAMTGSGGVFRDIMGTGQGAEVILSTDMFCFATPDLDESLLPPGTLHPDYLHREVVRGVGDYGNREGIPTANGSVHFHEDFRAKPTVIVGAYGILPEERAQKGEPQVGDLVVVIGGRTGRDGVHGATFSSGEMTDQTSTVNSSAVQIGNAIEQKRMADALIIARDQGLIRAITDCGAAGFASAIGEMAENIGVTVDIEKAPLKYPGLAPWEIWISESQERMVTAISPDDIDQFLEVCKLYNVEATVLGEFDGSHTLTVNHGDQTVIDLDYELLNNWLPKRTMVANWERPVTPEVKPETPVGRASWVDRLKGVLAHGNVCSKEPIVRRYDHGVQGGSVVGPFGGKTQNGPNDAAVLRPMLDKPYGMVQAHGMNPILNRVDPYQGTIWAIAEAASNYVSAGGNIDEAALVGNYIWPFPDEEAMGSLDLSVDAAVEMMDVLGMPVISGKDSLSSTYRGKDGTVIKIPPVYCASVFGRIPDVEKTMTSYIKKPGESVLVIVGMLPRGLGGSAYYDVAGGSTSNTPIVDVANLPKVLRGVQKGIAEGKVLACHDVSEGGLITTISEMCFGSDCGADINVHKFSDPETFLFSETAGCFIVEVDKSEAKNGIFAGLPHMVIGDTTAEPTIVVNSNRRQLFSATTQELKAAWQQPMQEMFHE